MTRLHEQNDAGLLMSRCLLEVTEQALPLAAGSLNWDAP